MRGNDKGSSTQANYPSFEECVAFHGHACPGLASGYRVAIAAMSALGVTRPHDEELVCIAETDACGVDAIQVVTGCTAGKGNLIIRDYGKHAFSFISRESGRAIRILVCRHDTADRSRVDSLRTRVFAGEAAAAEVAEYKSLMQGAITRILESPQDDLLRISGFEGAVPERARVSSSVTCERCGEPVAEARTRIAGRLRVCVPCAEALGKGDVHRVE